MLKRVEKILQFMEFSDLEKKKTTGFFAGHTY